MKNEKGVTLIALVITIIVLIILAAVSIAMLTGDNGILTNADTAKEDTDLATAADKINMELNAFGTDIRVDKQIADDTYEAAKKSLTGGKGTYNLPAKPTNYENSYTISYTANGKTVSGELDLTTGKITQKATLPASVTP